MLRLAADVMSGPGGLASWLRQSQLAGAPGGGPGLPLGIPLPLDTGEAEPTIPAHLRRSVTTRHTHCAFPAAGCPRKPATSTISCLGPAAGLPRSAIWYHCARTTISRSSTDGAGP